MYGTINWENKLLSFGIPQHIAERMAVNLVKLPYTPDQFSSIHQLVPVMQQYDFQGLGWWEDFYLWLQQLMQTMMQITPGIILTAVGGGVTYFLRNVKMKGVPIGLVGLIPLGLGLWIIIQPFLPTQG